MRRRRPKDSETHISVSSVLDLHSNSITRYVINHDSSTKQFVSNSSVALSNLNCSTLCNFPHFVQDVHFSLKPTNIDLKYRSTSTKLRTSNIVSVPFIAQGYWRTYHLVGKVNVFPIYRDNNSVNTLKNTQLY